MKFKFGVAKRAGFYMTMFGVIVVVSVAGEVSKVGVAGIVEVFDGFVRCIAHFMADVTSAEVGAAVIARIFGTLD